MFSTNDEINTSPDSFNEIKDISRKSSLQVNETGNDLTGKGPFASIWHFGFCIL